MTEDTNNDLPQEDELTTLKARATQLGIQFHPSIGVDKLRDKIAGKITSEPAAPVVDEAEETEGQKRARLKKECNEMVRVRVACMNPNKREWEGEIFTTGNAFTGTIKKYVPYDTEWHVPRMILTMMEQRFCQVFYTHTDPKTRAKSRKGKTIREFAIEVLPPLTTQELHDLAQRQAMANGTAEA